ncbi:hypothetical protein C2E23DRAFT_711976, partial [Lenzites betulinus]
SFVATAEAKFGPITIIRREGKVVKKIPWSAFRLEEDDWRRVALCVDILADATRYQQAFSSETIPTLHRVIPALETLCTRWEKKLHKMKYSLYHPAIRRGLEKLNKYYTRLDHTNVYILSLLLHPYYKLEYISKEWGGEAEQMEEIAAGNPDAINWQAHARNITEDAMRAYWPKRLGQKSDGAANAGAADADP